MTDNYWGQHLWMIEIFCVWGWTRETCGGTKSRNCRSVAMGWKVMETGSRVAHILEKKFRKVYRVCLLMDLIWPQINFRKFSLIVNIKSWNQRGSQWDHACNACEHEKWQNYFSRIDNVVSGRPMFVDLPHWGTNLKPRPSYFNLKIFSTAVLTLNFDLDLSNANR